MQRHVSTVHLYTWLVDRWTVQTPHRGMRVSEWLSIGSDRRIRSVLPIVRRTIRSSRWLRLMLPIPRPLPAAKVGRKRLFSKAHAKHESNYVHHEVHDRSLFLHHRAGGVSGAKLATLASVCNCTCLNPLNDDPRRHVSHFIQRHHTIT